MNAKQLIEILQKVDPSTRILVDGYEEGMDDPVISTDIRASKKKFCHWWSGEYEFDPKGRIRALRIGRVAR